MTDQAISEVVRQLADQDQRLGRLDARERVDFKALTERLSAVERLVRDTAKDSGPLLTRLTTLEDLTATLTEKLASVIPDDDGPPKVYKPSPTPQVWRLDRDARDRLTRKLSAWVRDVYKPLYGHLAARLPGCWPDHDLCLVLLDVMSELQLYYTLNKRTPGVLAAQAEFTARLLPGLTELLAAETRNCPPGHNTETAGGIPVAGVVRRPA